MGSPDPDSQSGSRFMRAKMIQKNGKKFRNFMFWSAGCSLLSAEGFSFSLDVLWRGLRIIQLQCLIKKRFKKFSLYFSLQFLAIKILDPDPDSLEMLDPDLDPDPDSMKIRIRNIWWGLATPPTQVSCEQEGAAVPQGQPTTVHPRLSAWVHAVIFRIRYGYRIRACASHETTVYFGKNLSGHYAHFDSTCRDAV